MPTRKGQGYQRPDSIDFLLGELEKEAEYSDMNLDRLLKLYKKHYPGEAIWMMVQDINRQVLVWHNIVEVLKRGNEKEFSDLRRIYESDLRLLPENTLSNPWKLFDIDTAFTKLRNYGRSLLKIARSYSLELMAELGVEVGLTAVVQVNIGLPPSLAIGYEKNFTVNVSAGAAAAKA